MRKIVRDRIMAKCHSQCVQCGSVVNLHVDHIIPLSRGGREDEDNMQILCRDCNLKKHNAVDYSRYFIVDRIPGCIFTSRELGNLRIPPNELVAILKEMFRRNAEIFPGSEDIQGPDS